MADDARLRDEQLLSVKEAARLFEPPPSHSTIRNWIKRGIFRHGEIHTLEKIHIGGRLYTSTEAVARFIERTN